MSYRKKIGKNVYETGLRRMIELYQRENRIVVAFSGGKDSGVILELCITAATIANRLPVDVFMLDDEIMFPGTFEYAERVANRKEVTMHWVIANEPMPAVWNRESPYWWIFDPLLDPSQWVRQPPDYAKTTDNIDLYDVVNKASFPPPPGRNLFVVIGNRAEESKARLMSIHGTSSFITAPTKLGVYKAYPIYDWTTKDVWKAVSEKKWDHNSAYSVLYKMGVSPNAQRIAPPTMTFFGMKSLQVAAKAWPKWYDKVDIRVPGAKSIAHFGLRAVLPLRHKNESWRKCFMRECVRDAPEWIRNRSLEAMEYMENMHSQHSDTEFPEIANCTICGTNNLGSWKGLASLMYTGDPYSLKATFLPYVQPSFFRPEDTRIWNQNPVAFR